MRKMSMKLNNLIQLITNLMNVSTNEHEKIQSQSMLDKENDKWMIVHHRQSCELEQFLGNLLKFLHWRRANVLQTHNRVLPLNV